MFLFTWRREISLQNHEIQDHNAAVATGRDDMHVHTDAGTTEHGDRRSKRQETNTYCAGIMKPACDEISGDVNFFRFRQVSV
jgi:hypothetical protein